jgi:hypothetical protein
MSFRVLGLSPDLFRPCFAMSDGDLEKIGADVVEGTQAAPLFERLLSDPAASYLQVHNAKRGCYSARVERA